MRLPRLYRPRLLAGWLVWLEECDRADLVLDGFETAFGIFEVASAVLKPVSFEHRSNTWFVLVEDRREVFEHRSLPNDKF